MCSFLGRATFCQTDPENHGDEQYQSRLSILMVDVVLVNKDMAFNAKMPRIAFCLYKVSNVAVQQKKVTFPQGMEENPDVI